MTLIRSFSRSLSRAVRACGFALLALGLFAPAANGQQHCGRYVVAEAKFQQQVAQLLESGGDVGLPLPVAPEPCKGASCSSQPAAPPSSPVATPTLHAEDWACALGSTEPKGETSQFASAVAALAVPIRRGPSIFHPPRLAVVTA